MAIQWPLLIFSVLLGIASGIMVFLGIGEFKGAFKKARFPLALIALILLILGGIASVFHLGHADRALYILGNVSSGLSRELFAVGYMAVVTLVYTILSRKDFPGPTKVFGVLALVGGIVLPLVAGASYMMPARPAWDSFTLPLMFLGTGIGMGFVMSTAFIYAKGEVSDRKLAFKLAGIGIICSVATMLIYIIWIAMAPYSNATRSIGRLAGGDLAISFWLCVVVIGIIAPIVLYLLSKKEAEKSEQAATEDNGASKLSVANSLWISFVCLIVGSAVLRIIMYIVGTSVEQLIY